MAQWRCLPAFKQRLVKHVKELVGDDGWMIGDLYLGDMTKEQLLSQAASERRFARGSLGNAKFYETMARPLQPGQLVCEYWTSKAVKKMREDIDELV